MEAAASGHTECVKLLIRAKADVNICINWWTALMKAAESGHNVQH